MTTVVNQQIEKITERIIGAGFEVSNILGHGFLEQVYRKALLTELGAQGLTVEEEAAFDIQYKGTRVGVYRADIVVERCVIVELKVAEKIVPAHIGQVVNYLKVSGLKVGLILNFGKPKLEVRRVVV